MGDGLCEFAVWAPLLNNVSLKIVLPHERLVPMERDREGYWRATINEISPSSSLYMYRLEGERDRPDPASFYQPEGVHHPSQVVDHRSFKWEDDLWRGIELSELIIYEIHVGTFSDEGTFKGIYERLDDLLDTGINAIEIMPVAQFPGKRNWGYDGVHPFAVQNSYGGVDGFKNLIDRCHGKGISVILDVVYNHFGPEGSYIWDYGPYFTNRYKSSWGDAINFDGPYSDGVRNFFIENALYWFREYHIDALRLDAVHTIFDMSAKHILEELSEQTVEFSEKSGRKRYLIAESDLNDSRIIKPAELGGYGIDAQWCDDFHHSLHALTTDEKDGYYIDFGETANLMKALREGYVLSGQYSKFRKRRFGNSSRERPPIQFIVFSQNHDQIGNRMLGERLSSLVSFDELKLIAGVIILSPYIPLLFMGEEYGEESPFFYFVSHQDTGLIESVREGRRKEFKAFKWKGKFLDPQAEKTFLKSRLKWGKRYDKKHRNLLDFYKKVIKLRKEMPAFSNKDRSCLEVTGNEKDKVIYLHRWKEENHALCIFNFNNEDIAINDYLLQFSITKWEKVLDSSDDVWNGKGSLLPDSITKDNNIIIRGSSLGVYLGQKSEDRGQRM